MTTRPDENDQGTGPPSNVLLLSPSIGDRERAVCGDLLDGAGDRSNGLVVNCLGSPAERVGAWADHGPGSAGDVTVVDVAMRARSAAASGGADGTPADATVETVDADADLVDLGETVQRHLSRLTDAGEPAMCVHSVSDLLQHGDERGVFKFLEVLTTTVDRAGAVAHYHLNPDVHDEEAVRTLEVLFDGVVDLRTATVGE
jgi:hypothetical protein